MFLFCSALFRFPVDKPNRRVRVRYLVCCVLGQTIAESQEKPSAAPQAGGRRFLWLRSTEAMVAAVAAAAAAICLPRATRVLQWSPNGSYMWFHARFRRTIVRLSFSDPPPQRCSLSPFRKDNGHGHAPGHSREPLSTAAVLDRTDVRKSCRTNEHTKRPVGTSEQRTQFRAR